MAENPNQKEKILGNPTQSGTDFQRINLREPDSILEEQNNFRIQRPQLSGAQHGQRTDLRDVLDDMSDDSGFINAAAPRRDKCDDIFDHENSDEDFPLPQPKTAGEELDADFTDTQKCFSFNVKRQADRFSLQNGLPLLKRRSSIKSNNLTQQLITDQYNLDDDSLNARVSNPSEASNRQQARQMVSLFHDSSMKEEDAKSGHFQISQSPLIKPPGSGSSGQQENRPSTGGFSKASKIKQTPNYGFVTSSNEKIQLRSPDQKVIHKKLIQKDVRLSTNIIGGNVDFNFVEERDEEFTPHLRNDDIDDEASLTASPLIPSYLKRKLQYQNDVSANNSLDISNIEMEGQIRSSFLNTPNNLFPGEDMSIIERNRESMGIVPSIFDTNHRMGGINKPSPNTHNMLNLSTLQNDRISNQIDMIPKAEIKQNAKSGKITSKKIAALKTGSPVRVKINQFNQYTKDNAQKSGISKIMVKRSQAGYASHSPINTLNTEQNHNHNNLALGQKKQSLVLSRTPIAGGNSIKFSAQKNPNVHNNLKSGLKIRLKTNIHRHVANTENQSLKSGSHSDPEQASAQFQVNNKSISFAPLNHSQLASYQTNNVKRDSERLIGKLTNSKDNFQQSENQKFGMNMPSAFDSFKNSQIQDGSKVQQITKFKDLFMVLGVNSFNDVDNTFQVNGKQFQLDLSELFNGVSNEYQGKSPHSQPLLPYDMKEHNVQQLGSPNGQHRTLIMRKFTQTPEPQSLNTTTPRMRIQGFHPIKLNMEKQEGNPNSQSHNDLQQISQHLSLPPRQYGTNQSMLQPNNIIKRNRIDVPSLGLFHTNSYVSGTQQVRTNRSGIITGRSGLSALNSGNREKSDTKSAIVSAHEMTANRLRSKSRQGDRGSSNKKSFHKSRDGIIPHGNLTGGLHLERQIKTSTNGQNNQVQFGVQQGKIGKHQSHQILNIGQQQQPTEVIQRENINFVPGSVKSGSQTSSSALHPSLYLQNSYHTVTPSVNERSNYNLDKIKISSDDYVNPVGQTITTIQSEMVTYNQWGQPEFTPNGYEVQGNYQIQDDCCMEDQFANVNLQRQMPEEDPIPPAQIHLAFLFASPLMLKTSDQKYYDVLPPISFSEEFEQIRQSIVEKDIVFNYRYSVANQKNFLTALRENPVGLHFSGHGFQNNENLFQGDKKGWMKYKNKGDVLIFENESGASDFFFTSDLKKMFEDIQKSRSRKLQRAQTLEEAVEHLTDSEKLNKQKSEIEATAQKVKAKPTELQFVYVASCHSEQVGRIFLEAGVPHVICIDQNETILDKAAIEFSKFFYDEVFDTYQNICDAYAYAKEKVEKAFGKFQADKIMLLKNEETHGEKCPEQDDPRLQRVQGGLTQIGIESDIQWLPNKVSPFVSRNQDMFDVLRLLSQDNNIVQIFGMPGLGKSSLLKNVTCHLGERDVYKDGVLYIDFLHVSTFKESVQILNAYLKDIEEDQFYESFNQDEFQREVERLKLKISRFNRKFLLSLDNIDHLVKENHEQFLTFLTEVASSSVKVLFTSNKFSAKDFVEGFSVKKIQKLKKNDSVDLFMKKIPLGDQDKKNFLDYENIRELHAVTIDKYGKDADFLPELCKQRHTHSNQCITNYLQKHPIFEFFAGVPLVISIVAPLSVCKSLSEIFLYLAEKNDGNFQNEMLKQKMDDESLIHCLEYCTQYFKDKEGGNLLELWYLIGMQGPGILYEDLKEILCQEEAPNGLMQLEIQESSEKPKQPVDKVAQLTKNLEDLIQFSLIEQEALDKAGTVKRYRVSPFVDQYIQNKMNSCMKKDSLNIVCTLLKTKLIEYKKAYALSVVKCQSPDEVEKVQTELQETIRLYEQQIMHMVCTYIKIERDEDKDSLIDEDETTTALGDAQESEANSLLNDTQKTQDQKRDPSRMSTLGNSASQLGTSSQKSRVKREKSKHARAKSRDVPNVSDLVKYSRSTVVMKGPQQKKQWQQMVSNLQPEAEGNKLHQLRPGEAISQKKHNPSRSTQGGVSGRINASQRDTRMRSFDEDESAINASTAHLLSQTMHKDKSSQPGLNALQGGIHALKDGHRKFSEHAGPTGRLMVDESLFNQSNIDERNEQKAQTEHISKDKMTSFYTRVKAPNLGFVDAKESFKKDRDHAMFGEAADGEEHEQNTTENQPESFFDLLNDRDRNYDDKTPGDGADQNQTTGTHQNPQDKSESCQSTQGPAQSGRRSATSAKRNGELQVPQQMNSRNHLQLLKQKSSDGGPFEKNVSAFEIAKMFNPSICKEGDDCIEHLKYDETLRISSQNQAADTSELSSHNRRRAKMLKGLRQLDYDGRSSGLRELRQSILDRSLSKDKSGGAYQLSNLFNPDIQIGHECQQQHDGTAFGALGSGRRGVTVKQVQQEKDKSGQTAKNVVSQLPLPPILEVSRSAPPKQGFDGKISQADGQDEDPSAIETRLLQLEPHEELFFHYLSILALLPQRRSDILQILDTYGQREKDATMKGETGAQFDLISQAEKRLKKFKTIVEIPDHAELLRANTMMLELYVSISQEGVFSMNGISMQQQNQNRHMKYDSIYEQANDMRPFYQEIQFKRGLAMIDYVQAGRQLEKFKKVKEFKELLKQSALGFEATQELDGIEQCLKVAKKLVRSKRKTNLKSLDAGELDNAKENQAFVAEIREIYHRLRDSQEETIKHFMEFRKNIKIPDLQCKLVLHHQEPDANAEEETTPQPYRLSRDLIHNMLVNPQHSLTLREKRRGGRVEAQL